MSTPPLKKQENSERNELPTALPADVIERILDKTGLEISNEIKKSAEKKFNQSKFLRDFYMYQNALAIDGKPSKTAKDITKALKSCEFLYGLFTGKNMDEDRAIDFKYVYKYGKDKFGADYVPDTEKVAGFLKRLEFVLHQALEFNDTRIGNTPAHTTDFHLDWLVLELSKIFQEIYNRKPTINSKPTEGKHNSPFLRFASQTMQELSKFECYDLPKESCTIDAIRKRFKRIKNSR